MALQPLDTLETFSKLTNLIKHAQKELWLVSPYVTLGGEDLLGQALRSALNRGVAVTLVFRVDGHTHHTEEAIAQLANLAKMGLRVAMVPNVHAKIYVSESEALLTSLNLLAFSVQNTIEFGIWSNETEDVRRVQAFVKNEVLAHEVRPTVPAQVHERTGQVSPRSSARARARAKDSGHCIRCAGEIPLNPERPYCREDYQKWAEWENPDYEDKFCHGCGDQFRATMRRPLCRDCYESAA